MGNCAGEMIECEKLQPRSHYVCICAQKNNLNHFFFSPTWLCSVKQVRMVTALAQLHQHVEQPHLAGLPGSIHYVNILEQNLCIPEGVGGWGGVGKEGRGECI